MLRADAPEFVPRGGGNALAPAKTRRRRQPSAESRRVFRRLLDEQRAMAREDPRRRRVRVVEKECKPEVVHLLQTTILQEEESSSSSSDDECEIVTMMESKKWKRVSRACQKVKFRPSSRLVEAAVANEAPLDVLGRLVKRDTGGGRALHIACEKCDADSAEVLLRAGYFESLALFGLLTRRRRTNIESLLRVFEKHGVLQEALRARSKKRGSQTLLHAMVALAKASDEVKILVDRGADPYCFDGHKKSSVMYAVERNKPQVVAALVSSTSRRTQRGDLVEAAVHAASSAHKIDTLKALLGGRVAIDLDGRSRENGETAMCAALASNNRRAVAILASPEHRRRCSLRRKNRAGLSPLYVACKSPSADLLRVLLEADPSLIADCSKPSAGTSDGLSLFFHALKSGAWDAAACMAENGVTLTLSERDDPFVLRKVFGRGAGEDDDDRGRQQIVSRGFSNAMRHLLVSQIMCDTFVVGGDRDGKTWQIGAHSFVLPERMLKAPHRTSRSVAMTALIYWYSGQFVEERCDNEELAKLALAWKLPNHYRVARIDSKKTNTQSFVYGKPPHLTMKTISSDCFDAAELRKRKGKHRDALLAARSPFYAAMLKWNDGSVVWDAPKELVGSLLDHVHGNPVVDKSRPVSTTLLVQLAYFADMYIFSDLKDEVDAILASRAEKYREEDLFAIFETAHAITLKRTMRVFLKFALFDKAGLDHLSGKQNGTFSRMSADSTANMTKNELVALILRACQQTIS